MEDKSDVIGQREKAAKLVEDHVRKKNLNTNEGVTNIFCCSYPFVWSEHSSYLPKYGFLSFNIGNANY